MTTTKVIVALLVAASIGTAAIVITYSNDSTVTTSTTDPPVQFAAGDDAGPSTLSDYVSAYTISTNKTFVTVTVNGVPEANLTVGSFFKISNVDDESHTVTLSTTQVSNAKVTDYSIRIESSGAPQGTLKLTDASPSVTFTIPASTTFDGKLSLVLDSGATPGNVDLSNALSLSVS